MADYAFVVAFAHKGENESGSAAQAMATHLRNLLDTALNTTPKRFSKISVSVAPGGVMFALPDSNPDRAVALCRAVAAQLEHQASTQHIIPAVCAVITHGLLRSLDVLGLSTNFEGWPAIAAARVLAKLSPGELTVEESAWSFTTLRQQCSDARTLPGKSHDAEAFRVCIHKRIQFPTSIMTSATPAPSMVGDTNTSALQDRDVGGLRRHTELLSVANVVIEAGSPRPLRVFLCHSSGDKPAVRHLYQQLCADGFDPWLDEEKLLPGLPWRAEIQRAVRESDVVIVCLSRGSIGKRGFIQREVKYALEIALEQPEGTIFLIPLKLEECEVPESLGEWQWVNFFADNGYEQLKRALRVREHLRQGVFEDSDPAEEPEPLHISSHGEFAQQVKDQIGTRLRDPRLQALHDAIVQQEKGATAAEDVLVPPHSTSLLVALKRLYQATQMCLQKPLGVSGEQTARVKAATLEIFGLLTGLAVDRDNLRGSAWAFDPRQGSFEVTLPLVSEAAIEVHVSALGERSARFRRIKDPRKPRVVGKDSFREEELEMGITTSDRLTELLKRIWVTVMEVEHAPEPFGAQERNRLQAEWKTRDSLGENCYYITLPHNSRSPQFDKALLQRLAEVIQPLRVIYFGAEHNQGLLFVNEYDLWALIEEFLIMVENA